MIGQEVAPIAMSAATMNPVSTDDLDSWERKIEQGVAADPSIPETDRLAIIRREGGRARSKSEWERSSPNAASQASKISFSWLRATASRGADSTNEEWLNGENGLLLTPSIDHLFDRGFIGFENNGALIISPVSIAVPML